MSSDCMAVILMKLLVIDHVNIDIICYADNVLLLGNVYLWKVICTLKYYYYTT